MNKVMEGLAEVFGSVAGWIMSAVDNHQGIMQFVVACAGIVAAIAVAVLAWKFVRMVYRTVVGTYRGIKHWFYDKYRWVMRRRSIMFMKGKFMARWKTRVMADRIEEVIFEAEMKKFISDHEGRKLRHKMAEVLGTRHIAPRPIGAKLRRYFLGETFKGKDGKEHFVPPSYESLAGPKQPMAAGGPPGSDKPASNVVHSAALDRLRKQKSAA